MILRSKLIEFTILFLLVAPRFMEAQQYAGLQTTSFTATGSSSVLNLIGSGIQIHQITWNKTGTLNTCSVKVEQSATGSGGWTDLIVNQTCTSNGNSALVITVANYSRVTATLGTGGGTLTVTWTGYRTSSPSNVVLWAASYPGVDGCAQIAAAQAATPAAGGIVDARGITGAQACASTISSKGNAAVIFGNVTFTVTASPAFSLLDGVNGYGLIGQGPQTIFNYAAAGYLIDTASGTALMSDCEVSNLTAVIASPATGFLRVGLASQLIMVNQYRERWRVTHNVVKWDGAASASSIAMLLTQLIDPFIEDNFVISTGTPRFTKGIFYDRSANGTALNNRIQIQDGIAVEERMCVVAATCAGDLTGGQSGTVWQANELHLYGTGPIGFKADNASIKIIGGLIEPQTGVQATALIQVTQWGKNLQVDGQTWNWIDTQPVNTLLLDASYCAPSFSNIIGPVSPAVVTISDGGPAAGSCGAVFNNVSPMIMAALPLTTSLGASRHITTNKFQIDGPAGILLNPGGTGNVGIGTVSPGKPLVVSGGAAVDVVGLVNNAGNLVFSIDPAAGVIVNSFNGIPLIFKTSNTTALTVNVGGSVDFVGKATTYNNVATVETGVPASHWNASATAQGADIAATNFTPSIASAVAGRYRATCVVTVTRQATTSSILPACNLICTDPVDSVAKTIQLTPAIQGVAVNPTTGVGVSGTGMCNSKVATAIQWSTVGWTSVGATSMQFDIYLILEAM